MSRKYRKIGGIWHIFKHKYIFIILMRRVFQCAPLQICFSCISRFEKVTLHRISHRSEALCTFVYLSILLLLSSSSPSLLPSCHIGITKRRLNGRGGSVRPTRGKDRYGVSELRGRRVSKISIAPPAAGLLTWLAATGGDSLGISSTWTSCNSEY